MKMLIPLTLLITSAGTASDFKPVVVGGVWHVVRSPQSGNCVMSATDRSGTRIAFIRLPDHSSAISFSNPSWQSLTARDAPQLRIGLNTWPYSYHKVTVQGDQIVGFFGPQRLQDIVTNRRVVALDFRGQKLAIFYTDEAAAVALREVDRCAGYMSDPFKK